MRLNKQVSVLEYFQNVWICNTNGTISVLQWIGDTTVAVTLINYDTKESCNVQYIATHSCTIIVS